MINFFNSISQSSQILGCTTTDEFLDIIENGDENLHFILKARKALSNGDKKQYEQIKKNKLPTYAHNFIFKKSRKNDNIVGSTGFIFLDVDGQTEIDLENPLIYASWRSLSNSGRGILVRVEGITKENFSYNYSLLGKELEVNVDVNANKPTQINVLSFDDTLYKNLESKKWKALEESIKTPHYSKNSKKTDIVKNVMGHSGPIRYDNLQEFIKDLDFKDEKIFDWGYKIKLSKVYHSFILSPGKRYSALNAQAYQYRCLNPQIGNQEIEDYVISMNRFCRPPLSEGEVMRIIHNIQNIPYEELKPLENYSRRFFFDESEELSAKEKRQMMMRKLNEGRVRESKRVIQETIDRWDFQKWGKITQKKLAECSNKSYNTIQKYYFEFKEKINELNNKAPPKI